MMAAILGAEFDPRKELLPNIVDHFAKVKPDAVYAKYPVSTLTYEEGYREITYFDLANAINGLAWWLTEKLGPGKGQDFETLAYIGPNDLRYPAVVLGAVKAGYCVSCWIAVWTSASLMNAGPPYITSQ
jgi:acyl-CoA synthetase (AMP-forming)/AMP-acid ligase II